MITRYNLMSPSSVTDIDNISFPDPLSIPYKKSIENNSFPTPPMQAEAPDYIKLKPYLFIYEIYKKVDSLGQIELDDIILDLHNIKHVCDIEENQRMFFVDSSELDSFISTNLKAGTFLE